MKTHFSTTFPLLAFLATFVLFHGCGYTPSPPEQMADGPLAIGDPLDEMALLPPTHISCTAPTLDLTEHLNRSGHFSFTCSDPNLNHSQSVIAGSSSGVTVTNFSCTPSANSTRCDGDLEINCEWEPGDAVALMYRIYDHADGGAIGSGGTQYKLSLTIHITPVEDAALCTVAPTDHTISVPAGSSASFNVNCPDTTCVFSALQVSPQLYGNVTFSDNPADPYHYTITYTRTDPCSDNDVFTVKTLDRNGKEVFNSNFVVSGTAPADQPPICSNTEMIVPEGGTASTTITCTDEDTPTLSAAVASATNGSALTTTGAKTFTISYTHDGSETTSGVITLDITDGGTIVHPIVNITVTPVDDPPICSDGTMSVLEGGMGSTHIICTDVDTPALSAAIGSVTNGFASTTTNSKTFTISFTHDGSETTSALVSVNVSDGVTILHLIVAVSVLPVDDPFFCTVDPDTMSYSIPNGGTTSDFIISCTDPDSTLSVSLLTAPAHGALSSTLTMPVFTGRYIHDGLGSNTDAFIIRISDGILAPRDYAFTINVTTTSINPIELISTPPSPSTDNQPDFSWSGGYSPSGYELRVFNEASHECSVGTPIFEDSTIVSEVTIYELQAGILNVADTVYTVCVRSKGNPQFIRLNYWLLSPGEVENPATFSANPAADMISTPLLEWSASPNETPNYQYEIRMIQAAQLDCDHATPLITQPSGNNQLLVPFGHIQPTEYAKYAFCLRAKDTARDRVAITWKTTEYELVGPTQNPDSITVSPESPWFPVGITFQWNKGVRADSYDYRLIKIEEPATRVTCDQSEALVTGNTGLLSWTIPANAFQVFEHSGYYQFCLQSKNRLGVGAGNWVSKLYQIRQFGNYYIYISPYAVCNEAKEACNDDDAISVYAVQKGIQDCSDFLEGSPSHLIPTLIDDPKTVRILDHLVKDGIIKVGPLVSDQTYCFFFDLDGATILIPDIHTDPDTSPPRFEGIETAIPSTDGSQIRVSWKEANEDEMEVRYHIYLRPVASREECTLAGFDLRGSPFRTVVDRSFATCENLATSASYCLYAQSEDFSGNRDNNQRVFFVDPRNPIILDSQGIAGRVDRPKRLEDTPRKMAFSFALMHSLAKEGVTVQLSNDPVNCPAIQFEVPGRIPFTTIDPADYSIEPQRLLLSSSKDKPKFHRVVWTTTPYFGTTINDIHIRICVVDSYGRYSQAVSHDSVKASSIREALPSASGISSANGCAISEIGSPLGCLRSTVAILLIPLLLLFAIRCRAILHLAMAAVIILLAPLFIHAGGDPNSDPTDILVTPESPNRDTRPAISWSGAIGATGYEFRFFLGTGHSCDALDILYTASLDSLTTIHHIPAGYIMPDVDQTFTACIKAANGSKWLSINYWHLSGQTYPPTAFKVLGEKQNGDPVYGKGRTANPRLLWSPSVGQTDNYRYRIKRLTGQHADCTQDGIQLTPGTTGTSFDGPSLQPGIFGFFSYCIRAEDHSSGFASSWVSAEYEYVGPASNPTTISAVPEAQWVPVGITFSWDAGQNASGYTYRLIKVRDSYLRGACDVTADFSETSTARQFTVTSKALKEKNFEGDYDFCVQAHNSLGETPPNFISIPYKIIQVGSYYIYVSPDSLCASDGISCAADATIDIYAAKVATSSECDLLQLKSVIGLPNTQVFKNMPMDQIIPVGPLQKQVDYCLFFEQNGASGPIIGGTTIPDKTPPYFKGIQYATARKDGESLSLHWIPASGDEVEIKYHVFAKSIDAGQACSHKMFDLNSPTTTFLNDEPATLIGLKTGSHYCLHVRSEDFAGNRDSNESTVTVETINNRAKFVDSHGNIDAIDRPKRRTVNPRTMELSFALFHNFASDGVTVRFILNREDCPPVSILPNGATDYVPLSADDFQLPLDDLPINRASDDLKLTKITFNTIPYFPIAVDSVRVRLCVLDSNNRIAMAESPLAFSATSLNRSIPSSALNSGVGCGTIQPAPVNRPIEWFTAVMLLLPLVWMHRSRRAKP